jgi:hypothetical protein
MQAALCNSRCASPPPPPKQNMSTLSHHVAVVSASSAVSNPLLFLSSVFERLMPNQRSHFSCLSTLERTPLLVTFLPHLHSTHDALPSAKFDQMSAANRGRSDLPIGSCCSVTHSVTCHRVYIHKLVTLWRHCCTGRLWCTSIAAN